MTATAPPPPARATVFFCHGSRDPGWRLPFERIVDDCRARAPAHRCELAFLELDEPRLPAVIDRLAGEGFRSLLIVPLFLAPGTHTRQQLQALMQEARDRWPGLTVAAEPTLTELAPVRAAIVAHALASRPAAE